MSARTRNTLRALTAFALLAWLANQVGLAAIVEPVEWFSRRGASAGMHRHARHRSLL